MKVAIHQPNFLPWLGFFDKMANVDLFISLDSVPFTKGGYQNRVQVKGANGAQWLTVPVVTRGRLGQSTLEVEIDSTQNWRHTHRQTLLSLYRKTPFFGAMWDRFECLYSTDWNSLAEFNMAGIEILREVFDIRTPVLQASAMGGEGSSSLLLANLVAKAGGTVYVSGPSGRNYLDLDVFAQKGLSVEYHRFRVPPYPQAFGEFVPGLSALDYCMNIGSSRWEEVRL
jgi:hypothetical protein